jgi:hypothetical protein
VSPATRTDQRAGAAPGAPPRLSVPVRLSAAPPRLERGLSRG